MLTDRDYFALAALPALVVTYGNFNAMAKDAYRIADAMMMQRAEEERHRVEKAVK